MCARRGVAVLLLVGLAALLGCRQFGSILYLLSPRQIEPAEFELTKGLLAIVIDAARPDEENPVFNQALFDKLVEILREKKVLAEVVPAGEITDLRHSDPKFSSWSIQRIGRRLSAAQVLYLRIDELQLREGADTPVVSPHVSLRVKVVGTDVPALHARLWPEESEGREVTCARPTEEATDADIVDAAAVKLGRDTAQLVARFFTEFDREEPVPKEP
ncbi:MAG: hypothetical protein KKB50_12575 [Planctomycetes bacterium]|nr:hypothetical protein [Planctomycetota bacterium]